MFLKAIKQKWIIVCGTGVLLIALCFLSISMIHSHMIQSTEIALYDDSQIIPDTPVALVLGAKSSTYYLQYRLKAAAQLFHENKVQHILVSGDNHIEGYDETTDMYKGLMRLGVPAEAITCDYAGFRTFDSIFRAKAIFGIEKLTVVSQKFHNFRAVFIAQNLQIDAVAFNAKDAPKRYRSANSFREFFARINAWLDLYVLDQQPKFLGKKEYLVRADGKRQLVSNCTYNLA